MKKFISVLAWVFVAITSLCLTFTMFSSYSIIDFPLFSNYCTLQACIVITMLLWSIKEILMKTKEWINLILCTCMGIGTAIFMFMKIY